MATIKDKIDRRLNDTFGDNLCAYLSGQFSAITFESVYDFFGGSRITKWDSEDQIICEQIKAKAHAYEAAYIDARREAARA